MMQRQFEDELHQIKHSILTMAGLAEKALERATRALVNQDVELAEAVIAMDDEIDQLEVEIDRLCSRFIVRHQPAATDLRFVIVAIKLGPEIERIADNAVNIAERVAPLKAWPPLAAAADLPRMLRMAHAMVSEAVAAYVARDPEAARRIIVRDDEIDALYMKIFRELLEVMMKDPTTIAQAIDLILVARFAERIADQATNISEEVVYLVEAKPIRHQPRKDVHRE
jgi:phosphate transport system protein